ncbi:trypsin-like serine peptidase [Spirulina major]|uniref:trypsin-like serine peptidase n=1 Tax=Spirulina major TaxID=270636 RepID=UPI00093271ED|nr:trypsin-like peptidase domain-containing protein [Spirulina major]
MNNRFVAAIALVSLLLAVAPLPLRAENGDHTIGEGFVPDSLSVSDNPLSGTRVVINEDERKPVLTNAYPYSTIGRVDLLTPRGRLTGNCTGTLIGRDLVLTNSHCIADENTGDVLFPPEQIRFRPNMIQGEAEIIGVTEFEYGWQEAPGEAAADWAILRLDEAIGDRFGYLGWVALDFDNPRVIDAIANQIRLAGYSGDFPGAAQERFFGPAGDTAGQHAGCSVVDMAAALNVNRRALAQFAGQLFHACDTNPGASGSALIGHWEDGVYVVLGLHAGANQFDQPLNILGEGRSQAINRGVRVEQWAATAARMWRD